jgi:hypothetical protein
MAQRSGPPTLPGTAQAESRKARSRRPIVVRSVVAVALILGAAAAYYGVTGFFNANGTWYGAMHIQAAGQTLAIETYMDVSTSPTGSLSGKGTFCFPLPFGNTSTIAYTLSGTHAFPLPGDDHPNQQHPLMLTAQYTVPLFLGFTLPLGPSLQWEGDATASSMHLTGGNGNAATSLTMTHGSEAAFLAACKSLAPLG